MKSLYSIDVLPNQFWMHNEPTKLWKRIPIFTIVLSHVLPCIFSFLDELELFDFCSYKVNVACYNCYFSDGEMIEKRMNVKDSLSCHAFVINIITIIMIKNIACNATKDPNYPTLQNTCQQAFHNRFRFLNHNVRVYLRLLFFLILLY